MMDRVGTRGVRSAGARLIGAALGVGLLALLGCLGTPQAAQAPSDAIAPAGAAFGGNIILCNPSATSIAVSVRSAEESGAVSIEYGTTLGRDDLPRVEGTLVAGTPLSLELADLEPDTAYQARLTFTRPGHGAETESFAFHTARTAGSAYTFCVQADSHPERIANQFDPMLYARTLAAMASSCPDFLLTLGDDFSVDQLKIVDQTAVRDLYVTQREWLSAVGAPVFLVNGNHEQAALANYDGTPNNVAVWAQISRNECFPQPGPGAFYSGDHQIFPYIGLLRDYYAFTWGDALFVVIDPYWHSTDPVDNVFGGERSAKGPRDPWGPTLGDAQFEWLRSTLEASAATFKFVFAHHVNGTGRGGVEQASFGEWGDSAGLAAHRPGWSETVHDLFVRTGVTIFFQGHDHLFARQELDRVVYQTLPEPANPFYTVENSQAYQSGVLLPNSGHLRVTVSPSEVVVSYVRSYVDRPDEVAYVYRVGRSPHNAPAADVGTILGRPTADSITVSLLSDQDCEARIAYTREGGTELRTEPLLLEAHVPREVVLAGLEPNSAYVYGVVSEGARRAEHRFQTQRAPDATFAFTIDADPHQYDARCSPELYAIALGNAAADRPDFHINLGDTFMTERASAKTYEGVAASFSGMRSALSLVASDAPLFLANGNHEAEVGWSLVLGGASSLPIWAAELRQTYYPGPKAGTFYRGGSAVDPWLGAPRDGYYAWTWGAALFVVLDPYWYTTQKPAPGGGDGNWAWTLGREQYDWLRATLAESDAALKFVFLHHLVGGGSEGRGGVELASFYEWGGRNADGSYGFDDRRPGWGTPIHDLLVGAGVSAVFHGHDHVFVKQDLDGIVYQEVPQPDIAGQANASMAAEYSYEQGTILASSGHLRVTVGRDVATVDYVRAVLPEDETRGIANRDVVFSYTIAPRAGTTGGTLGK